MLELYVIIEWTVTVIINDDKMLHAKKNACKIIGENRMIGNSVAQLCK